ncbi:hypothetical protein JOQ06_012855, partial [Pogonophryne albipinna]
MEQNRTAVRCSSAAVNHFELIDTFASEIGELKREMVQTPLTFDKEPMDLQGLEAEVCGVYLQSPSCAGLGGERDSGYDSLRRRMSVLERLTQTHPVWLLLAVSEEEATRILLTQPPGVFLVRKSAALQRKILSVRLKEDQSGTPISHLPVRESQYTFSLEESGISFADLFRLVAFYCISRDVLPFTLKLPGAIASAKTQKELEEAAQLGADRPQSQVVRAHTEQQEYHGHISVSRRGETCPRATGKQHVEFRERKTEQEGVEELELRAVVVPSHSVFRMDDSLSGCVPAPTGPSAPSGATGRGRRSQQRHTGAHCDSAPPTLRSCASPPSFRLERRHSSGPLCFVTPLFLQTHRRPPRCEDDPPTQAVRSDEDLENEGRSLKLSSSPGIEQHADKVKLNGKSRTPPPRPPPPRSMPCRRPAPPPPGPPAATTRPKSMPATTDFHKAAKRRLGHRWGAKQGSPSKTASPLIPVPSNPPPPRPKKPDLESHRCHIALDDETIAKALSRAKLPPCQPTAADALLEVNAGSPSTPKERGRQRLSDMSMSTSSSDSLEYSHSPGFSLGLAPSPLETDLEMRHRPSFKARRRRVGVSLGGGSFILPRALKGRFRKVSGMLSSLMTPERRAVKRIAEMSRDKSSYFGSLVQDYISFVQENRGCHTSGTDFLQTLRQFMTQMKAYLRQSSELNPPLESLIPEDQIDVLVWGGAMKSQTLTSGDPLHFSPGHGVEACSLIDTFASEIGELKREMVQTPLTFDKEPMDLQGLEAEVCGVYLQSPSCAGLWGERDSGYDSLRRRMSVLERLTQTHPVWLLLAVSEEEATRILLTQPPGVFLVRKSAALQRKILSVRLKEDQSGTPISHLPVRESQYTFSLEESGISFADLFRLVAFYCISRDVLPFTLKLPGAIASAKTQKELEEAAQLGADRPQSQVVRAHTEQQEYHGHISVSRRGETCPRATGKQHVEFRERKTEQEGVEELELRAVVVPSHSVFRMDDSLSGCVPAPSFWDSALCSQRRTFPRACRPLSRTLSPQRSNREGEESQQRHTGAHCDSAPPTLRSCASPPSFRLERRHSSGPLCFVTPLFLQTHRRPPRCEDDPPTQAVRSDEDLENEGRSLKLSSSPGIEQHADKVKLNGKSRTPPPRPPPPRSMPCRRPAPPPPGPPAATTRPKSMPVAVTVSPRQQPTSTKRQAPARPSMGGKQGSPSKTASPLIPVPSNPPPPRPKKPDLESHRCHIALDDETIAKALSRAKLPPCQPTAADALLEVNAGSPSTPKERGRQRLSDMSMSTSSSDSLEYSHSPGFSLGLAPSPLETDLEMRHRPSFKARRRRVGVSLGGGSFILPRALKGRFRKVSGMLSSLMTPERRAVKRIAEMSRDKSSYFGSLVQDYISFVQENRGCHTSGTDFLQTLRQFMTQMKAYLRQSSELNPPLESLIPEDQIDVLVWGGAMKSQTLTSGDPLHFSPGH